MKKCITPLGLILLLSLCLHVTAFSQQWIIDQFPADRQLLTRDVQTNNGTAVIQGRLFAGSQVTALRVDVFRDEVLHETYRRDISYPVDPHTFRFDIPIRAELANYTFVLTGEKNGNEVTIAQAVKVVAGDVYVINGQSNAVAGAGTHPNDHQEFSRAFNHNQMWDYIQHSLPGLWGAHMAKQLIEQNNMPIAIINEAVGGKSIDFYLKDNNYPYSGNYGGVLDRLNRAGIGNNIRGIIFFQGESDGWLMPQETYKTRLRQLFNSWQQDYNNVNVYLFQIRYKMCGHPMPYIMEAQRQLASETSRLSIMSTTNAITDFYINCHFEYLGGFDALGSRMAKLISSEIYGKSAVNVRPPNIQKATLTNQNEIRIDFTDVGGDLQLTGFPWPDFKIENGDAGIVGGRVEGKSVFLQLSNILRQYTGLTYLAHVTNEDNWITNAKDVGLLTFYNMPIQTSGTIVTPPVGDKIDLELSINSLQSDFKIYDFIDVEVRLTNNGGVTATGVEVGAALPPMMAYADGNASHGVYSDWAGTWQIPALAPGTTALLEMRLFTLQNSQPYRLFTEVTAVGQTDEDSSPANGNGNTPVEDDEALLTIAPYGSSGGGGGGGNPGGGDTTPPSVSISGPGGEVSTLFEVQVAFSEDVNGLSMDDFAITNGAAQSLSGQNKNYTLQVTPQNDGMVGIELPANRASDTAGNGNTVSNRLDIRYRPAPIGGSDQVDIEISLTADKSSFKIYDFVVFTLKARNTGQLNASDLVIDFPFPDDFVFTDKNATVGDYNDWFQEWTLPALAAGEEAILTLTLFTLDGSGQRLAFAQLMDVSPADWDATAGNDTDKTADEDDEALVILNGNSTIIPRNSSRRQNAFSQQLQLFPNPATDYLEIRGLATDLSGSKLRISDLQGRVLFVTSVEGLGSKRIQLSDLAPGMYIISLETDASDSWQQKFIIK